MEFLTQYGLFFAKSLTILIFFLLAVGGILSMRRKPKPGLEIESLNEAFEEMQRDMLKAIKHDKPKKLSRQEKKALKNRSALYVINFCGDIKASAVEELRDVVTAVLSVAVPQDEIMIRIESPGGSVNGYGLAASQLQRIRDKGYPLTACIDKVAASGGYLMACVADHIVAAPFAIVGSVGVVAQLPNFYRFLKKKDVDVELLTAGEYKRTLTMFAENTEKGRQKFQEELEHIHDAFKDYVLKNRPQLKIEKIATGEHWLAVEALALNLVDTIKTSDDYVLDKMAAFNVFEVTLPGKKSFLSKLLKPVNSLVHQWG